MDTINTVNIVLEFIIGVLAILNNSLVLVAIYKNPFLRTPANCFIGSLAMADLLVGILVFSYALMIVVDATKDDLACEILKNILFIVTQASVFNLLTVAIERFVAIKYPFVYDSKVTISRAIILLIMAWIVTIVVSLCTCTNKPTKQKSVTSHGGIHCHFYDNCDLRNLVYLRFLSFILLPLVIMIILYSYIFAILKKQIKAMAAVIITNDISQKPGRLYDVRVVKYMSFALLLFALCWLPINMYNVYKLSCSECHVRDIVFSCLASASHANSAFNPFLYAYGNTKFKSEISKIISYMTGGGRHGMSTLDITDQTHDRFTRWRSPETENINITTLHSRTNEENQRVSPREFHRPQQEFQQIPVQMVVSPHQADRERRVSLSPNYRQSLQKVPLPVPREIHRPPSPAESRHQVLTDEQVRGQRHHHVQRHRAHQEPEQIPLQVLVSNQVRQHSPHRRRHHHHHSAQQGTEGGSQEQHRRRPAQQHSPQQEDERNP